MTSDLLATISPEGRFTLLNPAWEQLLGWSQEELRERPISEFVHPGGRRAGAGRDARSRRRTATELENITTRYQHRDGSWRWLLWSARRDGDSWYAAAKDVTDRVWLERQALHDPLTSLPNRLLLMDRARQALARLHRSDGVVAMLFIDLDKFKAVNDNLGHDVGDRLLLSVSERLAELMRDSDTVARLGGDEFVILAEEIEGEGEALALAERVLDALERPFPLGSAEVAILASVGISVSRRPGHRPGGDAARGRRGDVPRQGRAAAGAWNCSTRACAASSTRTWSSRAVCATRCPSTSCCSPTSRSCDSPAARRSASRRSCAGARRAPGTMTSTTVLPVDVPAARRGQRADRADRQLGAARSVRAGGDLAAQRHHDPAVGEHLRARADRARPRRART